MSVLVCENVMYELFTPTALASGQISNVLIRGPDHLFKVHCCCVFSWASKDDVWNNLLKKDKLYLHNIHVMERHPKLQPKMRAILLDWLIEVCV